MSTDAPFSVCRDPLPAARVLYEDDALLVLDKPAYVSSDGGPPADMLHRARAYLAHRGARDAYVSAAYHLPRDVSGVLVLSRSRAHNAALAAQCTQGPPEGLCELLVAPDARAPRTPSHRPGAAGPDALRTHTVPLPRSSRPWDAVRTQGLPRSTALAAPVHLARVRLRHPVEGRALDLRAPTPRTWAPRVANARVPSVEALRECALRRFELFSNEAETDCARLVNDLGDGIAQLAVDRYGDFAVAHFYGDPSPSERDAALDAIYEAFSPRGVYAKVRPRVAHTVADTRREDLAPASALRGVSADESFVVRERGMRLIVRLGDGLSTGVFLDQRDNRARVRSYAKDRSVLNLFAYTAPFTVAAALGGARSTVTVDAAAPAIAWARRNLVENGFTDTRAHATHTADVFGWLEGARARGERFDLVLVDPPAFATTKEGTRFSAESNYRDLAERVFSVVREGGAVLACTNHRGVSRAKFRRALTEAAERAGRPTKSVKEYDPPEDFPAPAGDEPHLKSAWVTLR